MWADLAIWLLYQFYLYHCQDLCLIQSLTIVKPFYLFFRAGLLDFDTALRTLEYLDQEVDFVPWKAALKELNFLRKSLQLTPAYGDFMVGTSYIINLYTLWTNSKDDKLVIFPIFLENRP